MARYKIGFALTFSILFVINTSTIKAVDYYVSSIGSDTNDGTSTISAWKTTSKANSKAYQPGDTINFEGGSVFNGKIVPSQSGTAANPIQFRSYGSGRATITNTTDNAFFAHNISGISIHDLNFVGPGPNTSPPQIDGVVFFMDIANTKLPFVNIDHVDISGFSGFGIKLGGWNGSSGFTDVTMKYLNIYNNAYGGIFTYGVFPYANQNIYVGYSNVHDNPGIANQSSHTGDGIMISGVDGAIIEHNTAWNNGTLSTSEAGPVGIFAYASNNVTIQYNESHHIHTNGGDGDGFDLEGSVNSVSQYNYSHDNDGAGFLLYQYSGAPKWSNNTWRYNISVNDVRKNTQFGAFTVGAAANETLVGAQVYNNTIFITPTNNTNQSGITYLSGLYKNVAFYNNNIVAGSGLPLIRFSADMPGLTFYGNNYYATGPFMIIWKDVTYTSLAAWRVASGKELLNGQATGTQVDPLFIGPTTTKLNQFQLQPDSPLIDKGLNLPSLFGLSVGIRDYLGIILPQGSGYDVGAFEYSMNITPGDVNGDRVVNMIDIGIITDNYKKLPITFTAADINKDNSVDIIDIGIIIDNYGR